MWRRRDVLSWSRRKVPLPEEGKVLLLEEEETAPPGGGGRCYSWRRRRRRKLLLLEEEEGAPAGEGGRCSSWRRRVLFFVEDDRPLKGGRSPCRKSPALGGMLGVRAALPKSCIPPGGMIFGFSTHSIPPL